MNKTENKDPLVSECHGHKWELDLKYNLRFCSQLPEEFLQIAVAYLNCCLYQGTFREKRHERICEAQGDILGLVHKSPLSCLSEGSH